jgi:hypothetical protein
MLYFYRKSYGNVWALRWDEGKFSPFHEEESGQISIL